MDTLLWVLQALAALVYAATGTMKVLLFEKLSAGVLSFEALPRRVWTVLGILELLCAAGLIVPAATGWNPSLTPLAAAALALEILVFLWLHAKYRETPLLLVSAVLGLLVAFIAYGRLVLQPLA